MPLSPSLHQEIDRCVMCGLCSQHCPTYALAEDENESPRGRLALIAAINQGRLEVSASVTAHLDHCLGCRACEHYCPSQVRFGEIMDQTRDLLAPQQPWRERLSQRLIHTVLGRRRTLQLSLGGLRGLQRSGLLRLPGLQRLGDLLPPLPVTPHWQADYPPRGERRGEVALFRGCINDTLGSNGLASAIRLLTAAGYGVHIPPRQACCGALHKHHGDIAGATRLALQNLDAFAEREVEAVLHTASGCTAMLREYDRLTALTDRQRAVATQFAGRVQDISQFLAAIDWPSELRFRPLPQRVAVHDPCSLSHILRQADKPYRLLQRIPAIELLPLADNERCCGGAGSYLLTQPEWAARLRQDKLDALAALDADILLTSNIGCALHLGAGLRAAGREVEILHPVELLARQLIDAGP